MSTQSWTLNPPHVPHESTRLFGAHWGSGPAPENTGPALGELLSLMGRQGGDTASQGGCC